MKNHQNRQRHFTSTVLLAGLAAFALKVQAQPKITSVSPLSGRVGAAVTVSGANFSSTPSSNIVYLGAVRGTVTSASPNTLVVSVPAGATYAPITVTTPDALTAYSGMPFLPSFGGSEPITASSFADPVYFPCPTYPLAAAVGDLDNDGKPDLLTTANGIAPWLSLYRNTSASGIIDSGCFSAGIGVTGDAGSSYGMAVADLDGDGKLDAAVALGFQGISLYANHNGQGSFSEMANVGLLALGASAWPHSLAIADLNQDGKPDLIVPDYNDDQIYLFQNVGNGSLSTNSFSAAITIPAVAAYHLAVGDLDGDGNPDIVIAGLGGTVLVLRNAGTPGTLSTDSFSPVASFSVPTGGGLLGSAALADLDGDGKPDIIIANYGFRAGDVGVVSVLRNTSSASGISFAPPIAISDWNTGWRVEVADFNGDGKPDLVVVHYCPPGGGGGATIFQNNSTPGNISIAPAVLIGGDIARAAVLAVGDFDLDGKPDVVVASDSLQEFAVFRNQNGGSAAPPVTIGCPGDMSQSAAQGQCSAVVTFSASASGGSGTPTITYSPPPGSTFPKGVTTVNCTAADPAGHTASCSFTITVNDSENPQTICPANISVPCSVGLLVPVAFSVTATDNCIPSPLVVSMPASGSGFPVGTTTVTSRATDLAGNQSTCSFTVTRAPLGFVGFHSPIGGADATGGSFADPLRTFKLGKKVQVKFDLSCNGTTVLTGIHRLQVTKYDDQTTSDPPIDATSSDPATPGDQFVLQNNTWTFTLDTQATGMTAGKWFLVATLSDGSQHSAWIQLK